MRSYRYVKLNPTGNLTCLVLDRTSPEDEKILTRELLKECEQVAYLEEPENPGAVAAVRLMGGEFCGNAAMAAAAWLVRDELAEGEGKSLLLEMSGTEEPVFCTIRKTADGYEGMVAMPPAREIREETFADKKFTLVRMDGIVHLIYTGPEMDKQEAEELLKKAAASLPDEAAGLLQWNRETGFLRPLVWVRGSGSLVWENGCGSGSAAVGAAEALAAGDGTLTTAVKQPGGVISVTVDAQEGSLLSVRITGKVKLDTETVIELP